MPVWFQLFVCFWGFNAFVALWKQKFALCLAFFSQICIASLFATGAWPANLPSIATAIVTAAGLWWAIAMLAAVLKVMGRAVTPPSEQGERSKARQILELRGYIIRRAIFSSKYEVRSPDGQRQLFDNARDFVAWAGEELQK
jgi:hypothetical protein